MKIPELLLWYRRDFISGQGVSEIAKETYGLLAFIESQLSGEKEASLKLLIKDEESFQRKESGLYFVVFSLSVAKKESIYCDHKIVVVVVAVMVVQKL